MNPQSLAIGFVVVCIVAMWAIRFIGDWLYPPRTANRHASFAGLSLPLRGTS